MAKTDVILTRGVLLSDKKKLQRLAKKRRLSLNSIMLHAIDYYLGNDIMVERELDENWKNLNLPQS